MSMSNLPPDFCPYRGLQPYTEADRDFFFGRERDQEIIASNLYAAPLTILYGESGVGKSSVLLAGVVPLLRQTPNLAVVVFRHWQDANFLATLKAEILFAVRESTGKEPTLSASLPLDEFLLTVNRILRGPVFFIFDQFEEFFLYHATSGASETFDAEWARAVNRQDVDANFLISLREDGLSRLDRFKGRIPKLLSNMLRLRHLDQEAARSAILKPLEKYNQLFAAAGSRMEIEEPLVEALLDEVKTGRVTLARAGQGKVEAATGEGGGRGARDDGGRIETPFLQMVLTRLWKEEENKGSHVLRLETLRALGGAERIIRTHLDKVMEELKEDERDVAARLFRFLVTPSGTKIAHTTNDLISYAELPAARVEPVLDLLGSPEVRVLRAIAPPPGEQDGLRYEIFHDVLAQAVLDWHARYAQEQKRVAEEREREAERAEAEAKLEVAQQRARRLRRGALGLAAILLVTAALLLFVFKQSRELKKAGVDSYSRELAAYALSAADSDPELSLLLAIESARVSPTDHAVDALKMALAANRTLFVLRGHTGDVNSVAFGSAGEYVLTGSSDKTARVWEAQTGKLVSTLGGHMGEVWGVAISPDRKYVVTTSVDQKVRLWEEWRTGAPRVAFTLDERAPAYAAAFSSDSRYLVTGGDDFIRIWDLRAGGGPRRLAEIKPSSSVNVYGVAFSTDGKYIAAANQAADVPLIEWNQGPPPGTGQIVKLQTEDESYAVAFSADGKYLAAVCEDRSVRIWNLKDPGGLDKPMQVIKLTIHFSDAAFSPDAKLLATVHDDGAARLWEWQSETERTKPRELHGHAGNVLAIAFSPDGQYLVTGGADETARIWSTQKLDAAEMKGTATELLARARLNVKRDFTPEERAKYLDEGHAGFLKEEENK